MAVQHHALVGFKVFSHHGFEILSQIFENLVDYAKPLRVSSIYRVQGNASHPRYIHDLKSEESYSGFVCVAKVEAALGPQELLDCLKTIEGEFATKTMQRKIKIRVLVYEDEVLLLPAISVPYPEFHRQAELTIPAAEVWGDYNHPVLKRTIYDLAKDHIDKDWGEFFAQGRSLLPDRSSSD